ncbi:hypothetical protein HZH66_010850 [Vespula vulgaris]|uniref:Uncharacterized protein n=1 Tax=Vespula vulgaris TaxID=7454 RepID=A0A834MYX8_VESVU|nr:hypothetical protein HZH66_010850 [Vespula vulgaris]
MQKRTHVEQGCVADRIAKFQFSWHDLDLRKTLNVTTNQTTRVLFPEVFQFSRPNTMLIAKDVSLLR